MMIKVRISAILIAFLFLFNLQISHAGNVIGKVMVYSPSNSNADVYPLVAGNKTMYGNKAVIKLPGASVLADKGSVIEVVESDNVIKFIVEKGDVSFRIQPDIFRAYFITPHGEIKSPKVITANTSYVIGTISVKDTTLIRVDEGVLEASTSNGTTNIKQGEAIVLAQSDIGQSDIESDIPNSSDQDVDDSLQKTFDSETPTNVMPDELVQASSKLPVGLLELLSSVGEHATADTELLPEGTVTLSNSDENINAKVVDYALRTSNKPIAKGAPVKVVCISANENSGTEVLVRPLDNLYPQTVEQKSLIETSVIAQDNLAPEGMSRFAETEAGRSNSGWRTVVIDKNMQPDFEAASHITRGTELNVVCVRSTLVLQPVGVVNEKYVNLVGNTVTVNSPMQPTGKVSITNADSQVMQAILVDLNLQGIQGANIPVGTELVIVGVKETEQGPVVLVQEKFTVLEELQLAAGEKVTSTTELSEFGIVELKGAEWYGEVVGAGFEPLPGPFPAGTVFTVVSVNTTLLVNTPAALVAMFSPAIAAAGAGVPVVAGVVGAGAAFGTVGTATFVTLIANDNGGDSSASPSEP
ncbi:MAG: hypothetical protein DHS20C13_06830 [Thermodesulfobacteriota bacterium]|nr:MAG: hypothetical protein DHS20C13_06830 [Thermodesulfobacteriota bacterium]